MLLVASPFLYINVGTLFSAKGLGRAHFRFAQDLNQRRGWSGHLWQNRFFSCVLGREHLGLALCYVDLNPVRAGLVDRAEQWRWSSARAHVEGRDDCGLLDTATWRQLCPLADWGEVLRGADLFRLVTCSRGTVPFLVLPSVWPPCWPDANDVTVQACGESSEEPIVKEPTVYISVGAAILVIVLLILFLR